MPDYVETAFAYLRAQSATFKKHYLPGVADVLMRHGKVTRLIPSKPIRLDGPSMEIEFKAAHNRSTRASMNLMDPMPDPGPGVYGRYTVTFDHTDETNNDFVNLEMAWRTTFWDIKKKADSNWKDNPNYILADIDEGMADLKESFARYFHLPADGRLASLHGTTPKKDDDAEDFSSASSYTSGAATARLKLVDGSSIERIGPGQIIEIRTSGEILRVNNVLVTFVHPIENTIDVKLDADANRQSVDSADVAVTNFDAVAADDTIYLSGSYNVAPKGTLDYFFDYSQSYYGLDRSGGNWPNQGMRPHAYALASETDLTIDHLTRAGEWAGWTDGDPNASTRRVLSTPRAQYRAIAKLIKDNALNLAPATSQDVRGDLRRIIGQNGYIWLDPNFGQVPFVVESFSKPDTIDFLDLDTWGMVIPFASSEFEIISGGQGLGMWTRETESDGSGKPSKTFSMNGVWSFCFINRGAQRNLRLKNLSTDQ